MFSLIILVRALSLERETEVFQKGKTVSSLSRAPLKGLFAESRHCRFHVIVLLI